MKTTYLLFCAIMAIATGCATPTGKTSFPQPSANFAPRQTYSHSQDTLWSATFSALEKNRIATASVDKASGIIQTDWIEGQANLFALGLVASQSTRYKYNITIRSPKQGEAKLAILCKLESTLSGHAGSSPWTDITGQNAPIVKNLESWLYEQIENSLTN